MKTLFKTPLAAAAVALGLGAFGVPATTTPAAAGAFDNSGLVNIHYKSGTWHRHKGWHRQRAQRNKRYRRHYRAHRRWQRPRYRHRYRYRNHAPFAFRINPRGFGFRFGY